MKVSRRQFIQAALAMGASVAWSGLPRASQSRWIERRDLYPEGVASGDPAADSVILWTRRPFEGGGTQTLTVEVAEDQAFRRVIARAPATVSAASDWTCRVLVGGLKPAHEYWFRFSDADGYGSRIGRTITAPRSSDPRPVNFAFVSCQDPNLGSMSAYRRMIFEDEKAAPENRLGFVLHLGDFIYELVWYPEDRKTYYDRPITDIVRIPNAEKVADFHIPTDVDGYRAIYRAYLHDPDLQDARARWPFVAIWDNHEFSWLGWQSVAQAGGDPKPGQKLKVAANQAWFEYQPARVIKASGPSLDRFDPPNVENVLIEKFDDHGLGQEPNNLIAIRSLIAYRALRYGKNLDLIITDQRSYRSEDPTNHPDLGQLVIKGFPSMFPEEAIAICDGGRAYNGGRPPDEIKFGEIHIANPRKEFPPQTLLGAEQKAWFKDKLQRSKATWKVWGNSLGTFDRRGDPQNLPQELVPRPWPGSFASLGGGDFGEAHYERAEIYEFVQDKKITGFAIVSGDAHSFWAGYAAKALPPQPFVPVGVAFVGASITSAGAVEAYEHGFPKDHKLRGIFLADRPGSDKPHPTINMLLRHGVRSCLDYAENGDLAKARALSNPDLAPHLTFVDVGGHGYATVRLSADTMRTEFVCTPRPIERSTRADGGPLRYRVAHVAKMWRPGEPPRLEQQVIEGDPGLSI